MSRVLITDGEQRAALAVVRSLGAAGHTVFVTSERLRSLAGASRFANAQQQVPPPLTRPGENLDAIRRLVTTWKIDHVIPIAEASALALLGDPEVGALTPFPSLERFRSLADKQHVFEVAAASGVAVPEQWTVNCPDDAVSVLETDMRFPLVLKPSRSVSDNGATRTKNTVRHAGNAAEFMERVREYSPAAFPLLVQRRIVGPGVGMSVLMWDGQTIAAFAHQRIREKPPSGGVSVYRESIAPLPSLVAASVELLSRMDWQGVAMVEYKIDEVTGTPYLMEINPRFWGSLQLAIDAGVDFPTLLLACAQGHVPALVERYRVGVRSRWWWGEVDHLITRLRRSVQELDLPEGTHGRLRAVSAFFAPHRLDRNEVLRLNDPWPIVRESIDWLLRRG